MEAAAARGAVPTAEQQIELEARFGTADGASMPQIMTVAGDTARVSVSGIMTKRPNWLAAFFGGGNTTYADIVASIAAAEASKEIRAIELVLDTPGGNVDGMFDTMDAIKAASKPVTAVVANLAASAGYALASQADSIVAAGPSSMVGSVGIVAQFRVDESSIAITSTEAPDKAPDVSTPEGQAVVRSHLDDLHALFVEGVAEGRSGATGSKFDARRVNKNFGRGAVVLAAEALDKGMIDEINGSKAASGKGPEAVAVVEHTAPGGENKEVCKMTLTELQAQHPELYAQVVQIGASTERDRVNAHLVLGKQSGAMDVALAAVESGAELDQTHTAKYLAAGMNKADTEDRDTDDAAAAAAIEGAAVTTDGPDAADQVANAVADQLGYTEEV